MDIVYSSCSVALFVLNLQVMSNKIRILKLKDFHMRLKTQFCNYIKRKAQLFFELVFLFQCFSVFHSA